MEKIDLLKKIIEEAAHLLPCQAPLQSFVHHNTLHNFEHLPFKEALRQASALFGSEAFMSEDFFQKALDEKRINSSDLEQVIRAESPNCDAEIFPGAPSQFAFRLWRLTNLFAVPREAARQQRRESRNQAASELIKPVLIKLAASYLDQGIASKPMPGRSEGFLTAFRKLYRQRGIIGEAWMRGLAAECQKQGNEDATQTILKILGILGIAEANWKNFILKSLLFLRGYAGMFYQYEHFPEKIPVNCLPAKVADFLAVQLTLELVASRFVLKIQDQQAKCHAELVEASLTTPFDKLRVTIAKKTASVLQYQALVAAQAFGLSFANFTSESAKKWQQEVAAFDDFERRYHLHLAYEHHYHQEVLEQLRNHQSSSPSAGKTKKFQAIFCMDEREESLRRHLEALDPQIETFGFAGFFGVAMQYRGLDDIKPRALCPVVITPNILVEEVAIDEAAHSRYAKSKKLFGRIANFKRKMRKFVLRGALWSFVAGIFKIIPLVGRTLFPLQTAKILNHFLSLDQPKTRLNLERFDEQARKFGFKVGFSVAEMTNIVFSLLDAMDLKTDFAPLVLVIGHGSSSLNNPHESAYNCGATGGGKGSANARAFALMANHPQVRANLKLRGLAIPETTIFASAYHDTCNEEMSYFDNEPTTELSEAKKLLAEACTNNARERARRFDSIPKNVSAKQAKTYIAARAIDLAQPRPEYGHGTNAVAIIGRRSKSAGLSLNRRAFLISYNPDNDPSGEILAKILAAAVPVGAGINLEYYFSAVDPFNYGCNTKLPHNITGLIGVMDGYSSDLRTGLPWQTVEIHEPMRLLTIIEAPRQVLEKIARENEEIGRLVKNQWIKLVALEPVSGLLTPIQP